MTDCTANHTFHNWAQTITCKPASYCQPDTENKVRDIVRDALANNKHVRTVGAGHSWAPLALTKDVLVNLDKLDMVHTDVPNLKAQVQGGIRLKNLIPRLAQEKLALANIGSITEQSIAGVISTGTHGTGLSLGSISTQIIGMRLVTGTGDFISITDQDVDLLNAARLSMGALGIFTELTIQCVADYNLEYTAYWCKFDDIVDQMETLAQQNMRVKFWWLVPPIGPKDNVIMTTENPVGAQPANPAPHNSALPMDTNGLLNNFLHLINNAPGLHQFLRYTGRYNQILTLPLLPILHRECEYAIPIGKTAEALRAFKRAVEEGDLSLTLPVEVRFVAQDNTLLSPAYRRDVCYIGAATQPNANEVIERFEPIMKSFGGKPHWGKCFSMTRKEAQEMYPDTYDKFRQFRQQLDPKGVFANEFIRQMFI